MRIALQKTILTKSIQFRQLDQTKLSKKDILNWKEK